MHCPLVSASVVCSFFGFFFFKQKTAYEMRISDWSSDVCSSDLRVHILRADARQNIPIELTLNFSRRAFQAACDDRVRGDDGAIADRQAALDERAGDRQSVV